MEWIRPALVFLAQLSLLGDTNQLDICWNRRTVLVRVEAVHTTRIYNIYVKY